MQENKQESGQKREQNYMMQGMALVIIGGLLVSTVLTLILIPTIYLIIDKGAKKDRKRNRKEKRLERKERRREKKELKKERKAED